MKSFLKSLLLPIAGLALAATSATAANWPPAAGDLILGVQATGGTGATTNVFFNLGSASALRDNPSPGTVVNLDAELQAAFGASWATRTDLYFGVIGVLTNNPAFGIGSEPPVNGDPGRTIYASKGTTTAGSATPWSFNAPGLAGPAGIVQGQYTALATISANGNQVMTMIQASHPTQWNNSWTIYNPVPGAGYTSFTSGIQAQMSGSGAIVDLFRILGSTGTGSYITSVTLSTSGDVTVSRVGGAASYFTVATGTASNGTINGADGVTLYASGTNASLRAVPNSGFGFVSFNGDLTGSTNPQTLLMNSNKTVGATFAPSPSVTSPTATNITDVSATLGGNVTSDGGQTMTARGVVFAEFTLNPNPRIGGTSVTNLSSTAATGVFTVSATSLTAGTTYAYAAYGSTAAGTSYTSVALFTTDTEVSLPLGIGTVSDRDIQAGDTQRFSFILDDAVNAAFASAGAPNITWELRDSTNALVGSGTGNVDFSDVLEAGDYVLSVTSTDTAAQTLDLTLDASQEAKPKPDVSVGPSASAPTGANVYSPALQQTTIIAAKAAPRSGYALVGNDGDLADTMKVSGRAGDAFFAVSYFGPGNITAAILAGTHTTPQLASTDAPVSIRASVTPNKKALTKKKGKKKTILKKTYTTTIRATASSDASLSDSANIVVKTQ